MQKLATTLNIYEIFSSIQGESYMSGYPCTFIRLAGCNLNCNYCDTVEAKAINSGKEIPLFEIMQDVADYGNKLVEITGGEPLLQKNVNILAAFLIRDGYKVLLETNGSVDITAFPRPSSIIMDIKCPSGNEQKSLLKSNLDILGNNDEVKFVVGNMQDFDYAMEIIRDYTLESICKISFSPVLQPNMNVTGNPFLKELANSIVRNKLNAALRIQLHKILDMK